MSEFKRRKEKERNKKDYAFQKNQTKDKGQSHVSNPSYAVIHLYQIPQPSMCLVKAWKG